ncbi:MAG: CHAD domain-containing protein [Actinobacteria bacterium]|nr:CHAD domain-containing protein [Actinomycetota bacterium]MCL5444764.1 CHAD domain-containing protein [Actinomycetota bacterium]
MSKTSGPGSATGDDDTEIEWQFDALDLRPVERWLSSLEERPDESGDSGTGGRLLAVAKTSRRLVDTYVDTDDWRICRAGYVLRIRNRGQLFEATLKDLQPASESGLRKRLEITEPISGAEPDEISSDGPVGRRVRALCGDRQLAKVIEVRTRRRPFLLLFDATQAAEVALDETVIRVDARQRPAQLRRVEIEVVPEMLEEMRPHVDDLRIACGLQPALLSKFEAGLLSLGMSVPAPPYLGSTEISPESTLGDLAYAVIRRQLRVLYAREAGTRLGEDIEELHDMRVATRRLRAAIDCFSSVLPVRAQSFHDELSWLASVLGEVRDLDVQIERLSETDSLLQPASESKGRDTETNPGYAGNSPVRPLAQLRELLEEERSQARSRLLHALDTSRWARLSSGLEAMAVHGPNTRSLVARTPAVVSVPELLTARHQAAVKAGKRAKRSRLPSDFHRLRIRCKRLRYALEFTADIYGQPLTRFTKQLARLQDELGAVQDAEIASFRLMDLAMGRDGPLPPETVFAMGRATEHYGIEAAAVINRIPSHIKFLTGSEWRELSTLLERRKDEALTTRRPTTLTATRQQQATPAHQVDHPT